MAPKAKTDDKAAASGSETQTITKNDVGTMTVGQLTGELARPSYIPASRAGTEHLTQDDIKIPRLAIAQALSPQIDADNEAHIEGLALGDMFNSVTGENYGRGPLDFYILRGDRPRYIVFYPRDGSGGGKGVKDFDVDPRDPRCQWTVVDGKRTKPEATMFYDFYIIPVDKFTPDLQLTDVMALSMKSASIKVAKGLNMLIAGRKAEVCAGKYRVKTVGETSPQGKFYNYNVVNAGWAEEDRYPILAALSTKLRQNAKVRVDYDDSRPEDDSFDEGTSEV